MGNKSAKITGQDSSTMKLTATSTSSEGKHTDEFKFFDKALKIFDSERKTKLRKTFRELVRDSKTATIKWQMLPQLYDENTEKWKYNYFNALRSIIKTVIIAYDNRNPLATYESVTNLINLSSLVIDFRKNDLKYQERKGTSTDGQKMALVEWGHAIRKLKHLLSPKESKSSGSNGNSEEVGEEKAQRSEVQCNPGGSKSNHA